MSETELVERLERLEASVYGGQPAPQTITAHEIDVVDESGRVRLSMGMVQGHPAIVLFDSQGKSRMEITLTPEGAPNIGLYDAQGTSRAGITVDPFDAATIGVCDALGKTRAAIAINLNGEPGIVLHDAQEIPRVEVLVSSSGDPRITLSDTQGFNLYLGSADMVRTDTGAIEQTSAASIVMVGNDKEHRVIWQAP